MGEWRNLHNDELRDLHCSPIIIRKNKSRRMRTLGHVALLGMIMNAYRLFVGKREGKRQPGSKGHRCVDNNKKKLGLDWSGSG
jgi:hypothetical protein